MDFVDEPAVIYLCFAIATLLIIVESALPTLGVAGTLAVLIAVLGGSGIVRAELTWWPLVLVAVAILLWAIMFARRDAPVPQQIAALTLFGVGSVTFGVLAEDVPTVALGVAATATVGVLFVPLFDRAKRLLGGPPEVGLEALVGRPALVESWAEGHGTVRLEGSLWTAYSNGPVSAGTWVRVRAVSGLSLLVEPPGLPAEGPHREETTWK